MAACRACSAWILPGMVCLSAQPPPKLVLPRAIQVPGTPAVEANPVNDARDMAESLRRCGFAATLLEFATRDHPTIPLPT